jgi:membrane protease YdiL (CAAX protease family)
MTLGVLETTMHRLWNRLVLDTVRRTNTAALAQLQQRDGAPGDAKVIVVLVTTAIMLTLIHYTGRTTGPEGLVQALRYAAWDDAAAQLAAYFDHPERSRIRRLGYWAGCCVVCYLVIPGLIVRLGFGERLSDYGLTMRGMSKDVWVYGVMLLVMAPAVIAVSPLARFQATYPFYPLAEDEPFWPWFLCWEVFYALQFVALEFFFRGFVVHGTKHRFGFYAVFVMMVPYCMIHFHKPFLETLGAIIAGIVLGTMSLKTGSVWMGAVLHIAVAWSMDAASLWRKGMLLE